MNLDVFALTYSERTIGSLVFDCRIPPPIKMKDMIFCRQIQSCTSGLQRENEDARSIILALKTRHHAVALFFRYGAMQKQYFPTKRFLQMPANDLSHLCELGKNQRAVPLRVYFFQHFRQAGQFSRATRNR